jgi:hypothetical protein
MTHTAPRNTSTIDPALAILVGCRGKLNVIGKRLGVEVLDVNDHGIRVSFPFSDWPPEGIPVELDIPSHQGYDRYRATVVHEPETAYAAGLFLSEPTRCEPEVAQRGHCRVPTDLTVQVREAPHPRRFDAFVLNLSTGGALLQSELAAAPGHAVAIDLSLPCHGVESIAARVVYAASEGKSLDRHLLGIRFENPSLEITTAISEYIDHRLQAIY